jgi:hypothetical protein
MNQLKDNSHLVGAAAMVGVVASAAYFSKEINELKREINEIKKGLGETGKYVENMNKVNGPAINALRHEVTQIKNQKQSFVRLPDKGGSGYQRMTSRSQRRKYQPTLKPSSKPVDDHENHHLRVAQPEPIEAHGETHEDSDEEINAMRGN